MRHNSQYINSCYVENYVPTVQSVYLNGNTKDRNELWINEKRLSDLNKNHVRIRVSFLPTTNKNVYTDNLSQAFESS